MGTALARLDCPGAPSTVRASKRHGSRDVKGRRRRPPVVSCETGHRVCSLPAMSACELSVIAPCFNEEFNVDELARRVLAALDRGELDGELVLVDDGSVDGTGAAIDALAARLPGRIVACHHAQNRGIAPAWKTGLESARGRLIALIDADLQYQPEDLLRLHRTLLEHSVDVVQGWRSPVGRERGPRYHLSRGFNVLLNLAFGMSLRDNKSGFVLCAREVLEALGDVEVPREERVELGFSSCRARTCSTPSHCVRSRLSQ
jgi:glycosyltransferase involved in cell wall biosynthesis